MPAKNRRQIVVPTGLVYDYGGDTRAVYDTVCGEEGARRLIIPQNVELNYSGDTRLVGAMAGCTDGQGLNAWRVAAVPQNVLATVGGDTRPVYAFSCCPGGSSSSSSSSSSVGSLPSSSSGSGESVICCPGVLIPDTLYITISGTGCVDGTFPLTYKAPDAAVVCPGTTTNTWSYGDGFTTDPVGICLGCLSTGAGWTLLISPNKSGFLLPSCFSASQGAGLTLVSCNPLHLTASPVRGSVCCSPAGTDGTAVITT